MQNGIAYSKQARRYTRRVWFTGAVALDKGQGLCYDRDYGTPADADERRDKYVALPSQSNNRDFAGVTAKAYTADAPGQWIEIYEPGSVCEVAVGVDTVVNSTILTCSAGVADAGRFRGPGFLGRGSALALQTLTNLKGSSVDGTAVNATKTITKTGLFTNAAVGDRVYVIAGDPATVTPQVAILVTRTDANNAIMDVAVGNGYLCAYVVTSNPTCLALLLDGEESGLEEWISPKNGAIVPSMVGGVTRIAGGYAIAGDSTFELAQGDRLGLKKKFVGMGALGTQDYLISLAAAGVQLNRSTALNSIEIDDVAEVAELRMNSDKWELTWTAGATLA